MNGADSASGTDSAKAASRIRTAEFILIMARRRERKRQMFVVLILQEIPNKELRKVTMEQMKVIAGLGM